MTFNDVGEIVSFVKSAKLPEWQKKLFAKNREAVQVHSNGELFFKIDRLFPNEHPESKKNRVLAFEPITKSSFEKGISQINRIFNNSSYQAEASQKTVDYITSPIFDDQNLFSYYLQMWVEIALGSDPNALTVVYPEEFTRDKKFEQILFIRSEDILHIDNETVVFRSLEESIVKRDLQMCTINTESFYDDEVKSQNFRYSVEQTYAEKVKITYERTVYHVFHKNMFYRVEQMPETGEYEVQDYTLPNTFYPPVIAAGGRKKNGVYESHLQPFVAFGNLALVQHSQHTAVNFMYSFPRMSEVESNCDAPGCIGGIVTCEVSEEYPNGRMGCKNCGGSGKMVVQSPYKVYRRKLTGSDLSPDSGAKADYDDVKFYTPDVSILDYSKKEWRDYLSMAESSIYILQKVLTGLVESGESKEKDLENMYSFLLGIAKTFYGNVRYIIQQLENYMNASPIRVSVPRPYAFAILTEMEAFEILDAVLKSDSPEMVKASNIENFITKFFSQTSPLRKAYEVLCLVDLLLYKTDDQIETLKRNNIITQKQWATHAFSFSLLKKMYSLDQTLFEKSTEEVAKLLETQLEKYMPEESYLKSSLQNQFLNQDNPVDEPTDQPTDEPEV